jgi:hypothetical protein
MEGIPKISENFPKWHWEMGDICSTSYREPAASQDCSFESCFVADWGDSVGEVGIISQFKNWIMKKKRLLVNGTIALLITGIFAFATGPVNCYDGCIAMGEPFGICIDDAYGPLECLIVSAFQDCTELRELPCRDGIPQ